jgi:WD40 repeat protein
MPCATTTRFQTIVPQWIAITLLVFGIAGLASARGQEPAPPPGMQPDSTPELIPQFSQSGGIGASPQVYFGASGQWLAAADKNVVLIYDVKNARISRRIPANADNFQIAPRPFADSIAVADALTISLYDVNSGKVIWKYDLASPCSAIHFNADGSKLIGICNAPNGTKTVFRRWNADTAAELQSTPAPEGFKLGNVFSEDGLWTTGTVIADQNVTGAFKTVRSLYRAWKAMSDQVVIDTDSGTVVGHVKAYAVQALSHKRHSAIALHMTMAPTFYLQLVDVTTGNVLQSYQGAAPNMNSGQVSSDGTRYILPDLHGASIVDAQSGFVQHPQWPESVSLGSVALAGDLDVIAFGQGNAVILSRISHPDQALVIGEDSSLTRLVASAVADGLGIAPSGIKPAKVPSNASVIAKAIGGNLASRSGGRTPAEKEAVSRALSVRKTCEEQVKHVKKRDRPPAEDECETKAYDAESKQREALGEKTYMEAIKKFGGPVIFPPITAMLDEGRLMAVVCADFSWCLWDTATGNRLPYSKPLVFGNGSTSNEQGLAIFDDELREIEKEFGGRQFTNFNFSLKTREKSFSSDGLQYYSFSPYTPASDDEGEGDRAMHRKGLGVWDAGSNKHLYDLPGAMTGLAMPAEGPGGHALIGADADNTVGIWDRQTGKRWGTLYALQEGEWLLTTPSGLFDGSPRGWSKIAWRDPHGGLSTLPSEAFFNEFYRPGLLAELLGGHSPQPPRTIADVDRRQPVVSILSDLQTTAERKTFLHLSLQEAAASPSGEKAGGLKDVRLFRNGTLVQSWRGSLPLTDGQVKLDTSVQLLAGANRFVAYAFNRDDVKSADAAVTVQCTAPERQGVAYIVSVGVNQYSDPQFNLKFAQPDALHFTQMLEERQQSLGKYRDVVAVELINRDATKANIQLALKILGGHVSPTEVAQAIPQIAALRPAEPEDTVVLYFAGHGLAWNDHFYLIPHDLGFDGPRDQLRGALDAVLTRSLSDLELEDAFESIGSAHTLLIIDACNSGKVLDAEDPRHGPMNNRGLAQLAYEKGMYVLTASQAYESALESSQLGYGYLTFALAKEGLNSPVADTKPADGQVSVTEWFEYASRRVPQLQSEALNEAATNGRKLSFEAAGDVPNAPSNRLQTPRMYYRRDQSEADPIVYKLR